MKEGPPDLPVSKPGQAEGSMGGGDACASDAVEVAEGGDSVPECPVPPVGASVQVEGAEDPPGDWLEPLEDDEDEEEDWQSVDSSVRVNGSRESPVGENDGVVTDRKQIRGTPGAIRRRGRTSGEKWLDWPLLGEGWKRKEVFRRSGFSMGKTDTYYMSPTGGRARSKIDLMKFLPKTFDLGNFDYKSGLFLEEGRKRQKRRKGDSASTEDGTPSERSFSSEKTGTPERSHTPHSQVTTPQRPLLTAQPTAPPSPHSPNSFSSPPRLVRASPLGAVTPTRRTANTPSLQFGDFSPQRLSAASTPSRDALFPRLSPAWLGTTLAPISPSSSPERDFNAAPEGLDKLKSSPAFSLQVTKRSPRSVDISQSLDPTSTSNGEDGAMGYAGSAGPLVYGCSQCGCSYPGMVFRRPDQKAFCPKCKSEKKPEAPRNIVFRKWLPCGQCRACHVTEDCGTCASCRQGLLNPASQKPVRCRRRKCLCPIRKDGQGQWVLGRAPDTKEPFTSPPKKTDKKSKFGRKLKMTKLKRQIANDLMRTPRARHAETKRFKKPYAVPQYSDAEDFPGYDDDHEDTDYGPKKRSRRACWKCDACLRTTDCGRCDFCMDKPKFGGRNKKRQKCRLRQCQSHAMRHLLPFQSSKSRVRQRTARDKYWSKRRSHRPIWDDVELTEDDDEDGYIGTLRPGHYNFVKDDEDNEAAVSQMNSVLTCDLSNGMLVSEELYDSSCPIRIQDDFQTDRTRLQMGNMGHVPAAYDTNLPLPPSDPDDLYNQASLPAQYRHLPQLLSHPGAEGDALVLGGDVEIVEVASGEPEEAESTPVITQIFSLARSGPVVSEAERELLRLLEALRRTVLPPHWVGLMVEGPRLQLLQCSKLSTMADTVLQIEPGFFYQLSVQDQPLLLTHPLYEAHPPRLAQVDQVVSMLLDLERYTVCQGYPSCVPRPDQEPVLYVRAAACGLLVLQSEERCDKCDITQLVV
ncbi:methyl-CpG-binding domain protein 1a isoform X2 [Conger conger]|uniref:methyl-CpG-binding domain protein 1a isoform X2 n=1 Tax=Conger conger TaxID=82655 RepID=UPI002A59918F|nr:methyl-CpG-binding domain protein 1a isoform X2 [Conger conger]